MKDGGEGGDEDSRAGSECRDLIVGGLLLCTFTVLKLVWTCFAWGCAVLGTEREVNRTMHRRTEVSAIKKLTR